MHESPDELGDLQALLVARWTGGFSADVRQNADRGWASSSRRTCRPQCGVVPEVTVKA